jgi:hypothetical protein
MKNLPKFNGDPKKESYRYYTELIFTGTPKREAFKEAFPDEYEKVLADHPQMYEAVIGKRINTLERTKFVQECFTAANKNWWMRFMTKKQDIYENLYSIAMDEGEKTADRLAASKTFLQYVPDAPKEDITVNVEVKVGSDEFKKMLDDKKRQLHSVANKDVIDVEVEDGD